MRDIDAFTRLLYTRQIDYVILPEDDGNQIVRLTAKTRHVEGYMHFYADFQFGPDGALQHVHIAE